jgi:hypothetical protein
VSEVGGLDRIGFFSSDYDRKYVTADIRSGTNWIGVIEYWNEGLQDFTGPIGENGRN